MQTKVYRAGELANVVIPIGVQGENHVREIQFDLSEWIAWGMKGYCFLHILNPEGTAYPAATAYNEDTHILTWSPSSTDTQTFGNGVLELSMYDSDGVLGKSVTAKTIILPSFHKCADEVPDPYEYWLDTLSRLAAQTQLDAISVSKAFEEARLMSQRAAELEEAARSYATTLKAFTAGYSAIDMWLTFEISQSDWVYQYGKYWYTAEHELITDHTYLTLELDEYSEHLLHVCFEWETYDGYVVFKTDEKPGGNVVIKAKLEGDYLLAFDDTLSVTRRAADSKVVGDRIREVTDNLDEIRTDLLQAMGEHDTDVIALDNRISSFERDLRTAAGNMGALESLITELEERIEEVRCKCETEPEEDESVTGLWRKQFTIQDDAIIQEESEGEWLSCFAVEDEYVIQLDDDSGDGTWAGYFIDDEEGILQVDEWIEHESLVEPDPEPDPEPEPEDPAQEPVHTITEVVVRMDSEVLNAIVNLSVSRMAEMLKFVPDANASQYQSIVSSAGSGSSGVDSAIYALYGLKIDNDGYYYQD